MKLKIRFNPLFFCLLVAGLICLPTVLTIFWAIKCPGVIALFLLTIPISIMIVLIFSEYSKSLKEVRKRYKIFGKPLKEKYGKLENEDDNMVPPLPYR